MCGISGFINQSKQFSRKQMTLIAQALADKLVHRGPDDSGVWIDPTSYCALSHTRLSIIDLSSDGHQPMQSRYSTDCISFNGELYNFAEIKQQLEAKGIQFRTSTDTEVLLELYRSMGENLFHQIDAMFAFAIYDANEQKLMLARDPFGKKPLYYYQGKGFFAFASELSALTTLPSFDKTLDCEALAEYFAFQYVLAPRTIFQRAKKLPPGHFLELYHNGTLSIKRYFEFNPGAVAQNERQHIPDLLDELESILTTSIQRRLISDVPVGAFLSGGVDSSLLASLIRKKLRKELKTFSIGFAHSPDSEHADAKKTAEYLQTTHRQIVLDPDILNSLSDIAQLLDEPNADTSCLPTYLLSQFARQEVSVALSGDGGDEIFGGYTRYFATLLEDKRRQNGHTKYKDWNPGEAYFASRILIFPESDLEKLFGEIPHETKRLLASFKQRLNAPNVPLLHKMRKLDVETYMPGAVLAKVDRMSMQHALEVRSPFLSTCVVKFAEKLNVEHLYQKGEGKFILKLLGERYLQKEWLQRKKRGFGLPITPWARSNFIETLRPLLLGEKSILKSFVETKFLNDFVQQQEDPPLFSLYQVWAMGIMEYWLQKNLNHCHQPI